MKWKIIFLHFNRTLTPQHINCIFGSDTLNYSTSEVMFFEKFTYSLLSVKEDVKKLKHADSKCIVC